MSEFHPTRRVTGRKTALAARIAQLIGPVFTGLKHWRERQRIEMLLRYDDDRLRDLGVTRHDIKAVMALPLSRNPAIELERRRGMHK